MAQPITDNHSSLLSSQSELYAKYVPPLDEPLFLALSSDVDYESSSSIAAFTTLLDTLTADVLSHDTDDATESPHGRIRPHTREDRDWESGSTDATEITPSTSTSDDPETILAGMFPGLSLAKLQDCLLANSYDVDAATDELLNLAFLDQEPGDSHSDLASSGAGTPNLSSKKQRKKARKFQSLTGSTSNDRPTGTVNAWQSHQSDVSFLSEHTLLPHPKLTSLYHKQNASLPATIQALALEQTSPIPPNSDPADIPLAILGPCLELASEFPSLSLPTILRLFSLANQSEPSARALARALHEANLAHPKPAAFLLAPHKPPNLNSQHPPLSKPKPRPQSHPPLSAGHPASTSRIDLHGLTAAEALPLVTSSVNSWWAASRSERGLGVDGKLFQSREWQPLTVITGRGVHSRDHVAVLGPRVARMLVREGWKVRIAGDGGSLDVVGREGRR